MTTTTADMPVLQTPYYLRAGGEVVVRIINENVGACFWCSKPLARIRCAWDHPMGRAEIYTVYYGEPWYLGIETFDVNRHVDGSKPCWTDSDDLAKPVCGKCGAVDQFTRTTEAYGNRTTCVCGDEQWYDIGD